MNFSTQVHDFDPGITPYPEGLFWTVSLRPQDTLNVNLGAGRARLSANDMPMLDFFDIPNAIFRFEDPVSSPAVCSFDIQWSGPVTDRSPVTAPPGSEGTLIETTATMSWSATNDLGFQFETDDGPTTSVFAQLGRVRNGLFGDSDGGAAPTRGRHGATSHAGWDHFTPS